MNTDADWGPWVEHDGRPNPVAHGTPLQVETADGRLIEGFFDGTPPGDRECSIWDWESCRQYGFWVGRAVRYRIRKPRALRELIEIAAEPYAPPPVIHPEGPVRQPEGVPA